MSEKNNKQIDIEAVNSHIQELRNEAFPLLESMRSELLSNKYDLVVGLDSSGRLPAVIIDKVLSKLHRQNHKHAVQYISTRSNMTRIGRILFLKNLELRFPDITKGMNILVVDDSVSSGESIHSVSQYFRERGANIDAASLCAADEIFQQPLDNDEEMTLSEIARKKTGADNVFIGKRKWASILYRKPDYSRVEKPPETDYGNTVSEILPINQGALEIHKAINEIVDEFCREEKQL
jgi:adenine/guanine phosphoribosyltransferase-like PRPP-binding protein